MALLDEILAKLDVLPPEALAALEAKRLEMKPDLWVPNPGPQTECINSEADEIFFGGSAGGGKTALLLGLAATRHKRSLILRKTSVDAGKLAEQMATDIIGNREGYNSQLKMWRLGDKTIYFGGCEHDNDKQRYKGDPHDLKAWDEVSDFPESVFRFINTWNRSKDPKQRCRVIAAGNPPTTPEGLWVIDYWAPWLHPAHPNPAQPGELRWYTTIAGKDVEVDGPGPHLVEGEMIRARSRTFIRAMLADNPDLVRTGYNAVLSALPEELRDAYKLGKFDAALRDHPDQVIPTSWIIAAQERWKNGGGKPPRHIPMVAVAVDVAQGGTDKTVLSSRHDYWFSELISVPGAETPMGSDVAGLIVKHRKGGAGLVIDVGGGYGGAVMQVLKDNGLHPLPFNGANAGVGRTKCRTMGFLNKRAESWWRFREALDPDQPGGSPIELPDDPGLRADLAAPHYKMGTRGIVIEDKESIKKRIGRSPDKGDAVVMCWSGGQTALRKGLVGADAGRQRHSQLPQFAQMRKGPLSKRAVTVER